MCTVGQATDHRMVQVAKARCPSIRAVMEFALICDMEQDLSELASMFI